MTENEKAVAEVAENEVIIQPAFEMDLSNKTWLEFIVSASPDISNYIAWVYTMKLNAINQQIDLLATLEEQKAAVEIEYKKHHKDLTSEAYTQISPMFDMRLAHLFKMDEAFTVYQNAGLRVTQTDLNKMNIKWYHFAKKRRIKQFLMHMFNSKSIESLDNKAIESYLANMKTYLPPEFAYILNDLEFADARFREFCITYHYKRLYTRDLLKFLKDEDNEPHKCQFEVRCEVLDKEIIDHKQTIETLKARIIDLESKSEPKSTDAEVFWNKPKIDLIRLLITALDSKFFKDATGMQPTQEKVMSYFGKVLGIDLTNHQTDLSNGLLGTAESNHKIFDTLRKAMQKRLDRR
jgi:hypothetical protein